tara:strand:+ start:4585 stop:6258 length:1674 start_codon:yes stop_codon:yes gene_type:complete
MPCECFAGPYIDIPYPIGTILKINRDNQDIILSEIAEYDQPGEVVDICEEIIVIDYFLNMKKCLYVVLIKYILYNKDKESLDSENPHGIFSNITETKLKKCSTISDERRQKINEIPKILANYLTDKDFFSNLIKQHYWNDNIVEQLIDIYSKVNTITYCNKCLYTRILREVEIEETWGDTDQDIITRKQHKLFKLFCNDTHTLHPRILSEITTYNFGTTSLFYDELENTTKQVKISKGLIDKLKEENKLKDQLLKRNTEEKNIFCTKLKHVLIAGIEGKKAQIEYLESTKADEIPHNLIYREELIAFNSMYSSLIEFTDADRIRKAVKNDNSISYTDYISITANFEKSSLIIQRFYRGFICRKKLYTANKIKKIITIQCLYRSYIARRSLKQLKTQKEKELNAAIFIQKFSRMRIQQVKYIKIKKKMKELEELGVYSPIKSPKNNIYTEPEPEPEPEYVDTYTDDNNNVYDENPPNEYICSITQSLMVEPVITSRGNTYEKKNIKEWFKSGKNKKEKVTDPLTGLKLRNKQLLTNVSLKNLITEWKEKHFLYSQKKD